MLCAQEGAAQTRTRPVGDRGTKAKVKKNALLGAVGRAVFAQGYLYEFILPISVSVFLV